MTLRTITYLAILTFLVSCNNNRQENPKINIDTASSRLSDNIPQEQTQDIDSFPFDTILNNCFNAPIKDTNLIGGDGNLAGGSTMGMIGCYDYATNQLDKLVNNIYSNTYSKLDKDDKQKLKLSQDNWRNFYNAEGEFLYSAFYTWANKSKYGHGREHAIMLAEWRYNVMRERLINLKKYDNEIWVDENDTK
ncbi:MAG: lysozyme inhibitor LprI family protein [Bacteroidota bacterium]